MNRCIGILALLALAAGGPRDARAFTAIVPDDYPGIQAAHDAGATVIQVRAGTYPGAIVITHSCTIEPAAPVSPSNWTPFPWIQGSLSIVSTSPPTPDVVVRGLRISGLVTSDANNVSGSNAFLDCRMDSGLVLSSGTVASVRHCLVTSGGIRAHGCWSTDITANSVVGGIEVTSSEGGAVVQSNLVIGPANYGIQGRDTDGDVSVLHNVVQGAKVGIDYNAGASRTLEGNQVSGCTEDGIVASFYYGSGTLLDNRVTDCGGRGMVVTVESPFTARLVMRRNVVERVAGHGLDLLAPGGSLTGNRVVDVLGAGVHLPAPGHLDSLADNVVLRAGGSGFDLASASDLRFNVAGRAGGDGVRVLDSPAGLVLDRNTSYLNGGDGYDLASASATAVGRAIAHGNAGFGLRVAGAAPALSCNDWFSNVLGAVSGAAPGPSDLAVNPEFCDLAGDDVTLASASPLAGGPCAVVGARDVGCAGGVAVIEPEARRRRLTAAPSPAASAVSLSFPASEGEAVIELFDAAGALRRSARVAAGTSTWAWDLRDDAGHAVGAGVYFARWSAAAGALTTRVVIAR